MEHLVEAIEDLPLAVAREQRGKDRASRHFVDDRAELREVRGLSTVEAREDVFQTMALPGRATDLEVELEREERSLPVGGEVLAARPPALEIVHRHRSGL